MRLYLDTNRTTLIFSGKVIPKAEYVELTNGERRRSGNQAKDENGTPLWTMDCFSADDDSMRAEVVAVTVASHEEPTARQFAPVKFVNLRANVYVNSQTGRAATSLRADGVEGANQAPKAA
ncbi:hypothetical protein ACL02T_15280 [Pseudonocardia sp. RS010]|uniref:hypothetical protein n=1 Tax=Pseudonocardia sp. RS010 TaxID=3385979 RepID=UPI0039A082CA